MTPQEMYEEGWIARNGLSGRCDDSEAHQYFDDSQTKAHADSITANLAKLERLEPGTIIYSPSRDTLDIMGVHDGGRPRTMDRLVGVVYGSSLRTDSIPYSFLELIVHGGAKVSLASERAVTLPSEDKEGKDA